MMRRPSFAILVLLAAAGVLAACGPKRAAPRPSGSPVSAPGAIPAAAPLLEALAENPDDVSSRLALAAARREAGDLEGALLEAYKALVSDPRSVDAHVERARIYFERGLPAREIEAYRAALAIDAARVDVRENLGHALLADGLLDEAVAEYRAVLASKPDAGAALFNLARIVTDAGANPGEARLLWSRYLELDPASEWARQAREALAALPARQGAQ